MHLYVRVRPGTINFVHTVAELSTFEESYFPGTKILLGDLSVFNKPMLNRLLKLLEENPLIDCYSSADIQDPVLLSRFIGVKKEPIVIPKNPSDDNFMKSDKSYVAVRQYLEFTPRVEMLAVGASKLELALLQYVSKKK